MLITTDEELFDFGLSLGFPKGEIVQMKTNHPDSVQISGWFLACEWWESSLKTYEEKSHILAESALELGKIEVKNQIQEMLTNDRKRSERVAGNVPELPNNHQNAKQKVNEETQAKTVEYDRLSCPETSPINHKQRFNEISREQIVITQGTSTNGEGETIGLPIATGPKGNSLATQVGTGTNGTHKKPANPALLGVCWLPVATAQKVAIVSNDLASNVPSEECNKDSEISLPCQHSLVLRKDKETRKQPAMSEAGVSSSSTGSSSLEFHGSELFRPVSTPTGSGPKSRAQSSSSGDCVASYSSKEMTPGCNDNCRAPDNSNKDSITPEGSSSMTLEGNGNESMTQEGNSKDSMTTEGSSHRTPEVNGKMTLEGSDNMTTEGSCNMTPRGSGNENMTPECNSKDNMLTEASSYRPPKDNGNIIPERSGNDNMTSEGYSKESMPSEGSDITEASSVVQMQPNGNNESNVVSRQSESEDHLESSYSSDDFAMTTRSSPDGRSMTDPTSDVAGHLEGEKLTKVIMYSDENQNTCMNRDVALLGKAVLNGSINEHESEDIKQKYTDIYI